MPSPREVGRCLRYLATTLAVSLTVLGGLLLFRPQLPVPVAELLASAAWLLAVLAGGVAIFGSPFRGSRITSAARDGATAGDDRLRALITGLEAAIFEIDRSTGEFTFISPRIAEMTGFEEERWIASPRFWLERIHEDDREMAHRTLQRVARGGGAATLEYRLVTSDGDLRWFRHSLHVAAEGRSDRLQGWIHDITDRKLVQGERLRSQRMESLALLAGGIAHDFNNLLQGILGSVSLARHQPGLDPDTRDHLELTELAANKARGLTQQLLDFSRGEATDPRVVAIGELVRQTVRFNLGGSNVRAEFEIEPSSLCAEVDDGQIRQAVGNIVINADQAMPDGGVLQVRVGSRLVTADDTLPVPAGRYLVIEFRDEGPGVPPLLLPKIFDPYVTTKSGGSGLGLANSYSIVRRHGGHISVDSGPDGATFSLFLPATNSEPEIEELVVMPGAAGNRVLIMDDETIVLEILGAALEQMGCRCERVENGDQAVAAYRAAVESGEPFDLVILDLTIPGGVGGPETLHRIQAIDAGVKAIATSGYVEDPVMRNPRGHGFARALAKPYDVDHLANTLGEVLARRAE